MVDAIDSKSIDPQGHEGSTPSLGTTKYKNYLAFGADVTGAGAGISCLVPVSSTFLGVSRVG